MAEQEAQLLLKFHLKKASIKCLKVAILRIAHAAIHYCIYKNKVYYFFIFMSCTISLTS